MREYTFDKTSSTALPPPFCPPSRLSPFSAVGEEGKKGIGSKGKKITWHNSRREWLLSIRDCISQILIRRLSLARTFALGAARIRERKRGREKWGGSETKGRQGVHNVRDARETKRAENNVKEGRISPSVPLSGASPKKVEKGPAAKDEGCRPDGMRSPSRWRASCCNAKLKQNYLVPLSYGGTLGGIGTRESESLRGGEGYCRRPGAIVSCQGCILTRIKNGCLRPYSTDGKESCERVARRLCAQICARTGRSGGMFCLSTLNGGSRIYRFTARADAYRFMLFGDNSLSRERGRKSSLR